jgi:TRAP-type C4-dicarboxylate transport system substrate-binding protein
MKMKRFFGPIVAFMLTVTFVMMPVVGGLAKAAEPITLSFVSFVPLANKVEFQQIKSRFIDRVNERAKGELFIKVRGGPEAIPPFNLGVSVQKGVIDMATIPTAFFDALVPGADETCMSDYTAWEERENGIYEYIRDMYKKAGLYYLGRAGATEPGFFFLYINKRAEKPADFKGLKLGGSTAFHGFYRELGASIATLAIPEYHSAMERGVVDGVVTSLPVGIQFGLHEISKYLILPSFYRATPALPINLKKWNSLPKHLQDLMTECMAQFEKEFSAFEKEERASDLKRVEAAGVEIIRYPPDMAKWFLNAAAEGAWKNAQKRFPGDVIPKLKERITKK